MKHKIYLFAIAVLFFFTAYAQPQFTQQMFNRMNLNPAFTGLKSAAAPDTADSKQLDIIGRSFTANNAEYSLMTSYQTPFGKKKKSGFGIMFNYNNESYIPDFFSSREVAFLAPQPTTLYNQYAAKLYYRYTLVPGFYIGASIGIIDMYLTEHTTWGDFPPYDYTYPAQNFVAPDFDFGMAYNWKHLFFGLSLGHINEPNYDIYKEDMPNYTGMSLNFTIGGNINLWKTRLVLMGSLYNYNISGSMLFYPVKYVFVGSSFTLITDFSENGFEDIGGDLSYASIMLGCDFFKSRLRVSFSLDILPSSYYSYYPKSLPNAESWMGYSF